MDSNNSIIASNFCHNINKKALTKEYHGASFPHTSQLLRESRYISYLYKTQTFILMFIFAHYMTLPWASSIKFTSPHHISLTYRSIDSHLWFVSHITFPPQICRPKFYVHATCPIDLLYFVLIPFIMLMQKTHYEAFYHLIFSNLLLLLLCYIQMFFSALCFQTPSNYVLPLGRETRTNGLISLH